MKAKIYQLNPQKADREIITMVCDSIKKGAIVSYPTETFYGLGASIYSEVAIERIFTIKGREEGKPLPLIIPNKNTLKELTSDVPGIAFSLMEKFWPGGLTMIFWASSLVSPRITGGTGKIGVRISSHPIAHQMVSILNSPLTATSANRSGEKACSTAQEVSDILGDTLDIIIDAGIIDGTLPSTVLDLTQTPPRILREGVIGEEKISLYISSTISKNAT